MTDWRRVVEADYPVPADRTMADLVDELLAMLRSPDPVVRDTLAYSILARWISRGLVDDLLRPLGDTMTARFNDLQIQARTFAPLILAEVVTRGAFSADWLAAFHVWYAEERDVRGYDPHLGWLHAVAHGADLLGALARSPSLGAKDLAGLLDLAATRLLAPTDYLFSAWEDDRMAVAVAAVLTRPELTRTQALNWLAVVADRCAAAGWPTPVPAWLSNTMRTLRVLYILVDRGVRPEAGTGPVNVAHREPLRERIAEVLALVIRQLA